MLVQQGKGRTNECMCTRSTQALPFSQASSYLMPGAKSSLLSREEAFVFPRQFTERLLMTLWASILAHIFTVADWLGSTVLEDSVKKTLRNPTYHQSLQVNPHFIIATRLARGRLKTTCFFPAGSWIKYIKVGEISLPFAIILVRMMLI